MHLICRTARFLFRIVASIILIAIMAILITGISPVYRFQEPSPFEGPDIFNPYRNIDTTFCWKRANFHTHTRVEGILNECEYWPDKVYDEYMKYGYDIVTFSNHNELTQHPYDPALQVNVYEHGWNLLKFHKLVFGCSDEMRFDHILPVTASQKQFQINLLRKDSDIIQINHPLRTFTCSKEQMQKLGGYQIMELDSGKSTENEYWDWALSAGRYSFALANDDLHYPDRSRCIAVRCNFLCCPSAGYDDIRKTLLDGCYYSMRVPDYGKGNPDEKTARNKALPHITDIGLADSTAYISLSRIADSIKVTGQDHRTLMMTSQTDNASYTFRKEDPYARFTAYFPDGEVIYTNPFARYDSSVAEMPACAIQNEISAVLTILYNLTLALACALTAMGFIKLNFKNGKDKE